MDQKRMDFVYLTVLFLFQIYKYLTDLAANLPSKSPISTEWPPCKYAVVADAHAQLKTIFHAWRVR